MGLVLVGTCGWTDPTLLGSGWYPIDARTAEARLQHYAAHFSLAEVDSTYYALPSPRNAGLWAERTPADFTFDVKVFRLFTQHPTPRPSFPKDVQKELAATRPGASNLYFANLPQELRTEMLRRFLDALLPLESAGKLGVVLFQFPPWFLPTDESREFILGMKESMGLFRMAVEFRSGSWFNDRSLERTISFLEGNHLPLVSVDGPQGFQSSVPPLPLVTADSGLVRFHGRNAETWEKKGITATERFRYLYSQEELQEWVPKLKEMASKTKQLHVLMNNCYADYAVMNGQQVSLLLGEEQSGTIGEA